MRKKAHEKNYFEKGKREENDIVKEEENEVILITRKMEIGRKRREVAIKEKNKKKPRDIVRI